MCHSIQELSLKREEDMGISNYDSIIENQAVAEHDEWDKEYDGLTEKLKEVVIENFEADEIKFMEENNII